MGTADSKKKVANTQDTMRVEIGNNKYNAIGHVEDKTLKFRVMGTESTYVILEDAILVSLENQEKCSTVKTIPDAIEWATFNETVVDGGRTSSEFKLTWHGTDLIVFYNDRIILHVPNYNKLLHSPVIQSVFMYSSGDKRCYEFNPSVQPIQMPDIPPPPAYSPYTEVSNLISDMAIGGPNVDSASPVFHLLRTHKNQIVNCKKGMFKWSLSVSSQPFNGPEGLKLEKKSSSFTNHFQFVPVRVNEKGATLYKIQVGEQTSHCLGIENDVGHVFHKRNGHFDYSTKPVREVWEGHPNQLWELVQLEKPIPGEAWNKTEDFQYRIHSGAQKGRQYVIAAEGEKLVMKIVNDSDTSTIFRFDNRVPQFSIDDSKIKIQEASQSLLRMRDGRTFIPSFGHVGFGHHLHEWTGPSKSSIQVLIRRCSPNSEEFWIELTNKNGANPHVMDIATPEWHKYKGDNPADYKPDTIIHLIPNHGHKNQKWLIESAGGDSYRIRAAGNRDMALDLSHPHPCGWAGSDSLYHLRLQPYNPNSENQLFNLGATVLEGQGYMQPHFSK